MNHGHAFFSSSFPFPSFFLTLSFSLLLTTPRASETTERRTQRWKVRKIRPAKKHPPGLYALPTHPHGQRLPKTITGGSNLGAFQALPAQNYPHFCRTLVIFALNMGLAGRTCCSVCLLFGASPTELQCTDLQAFATKLSIPSPHHKKLPLRPLPHVEPRRRLKMLSA